MKKRKIIQKRKTKIASKKILAKRRLPIIHQSKKLICCLRLLEHKHTGKFVHHKNTSHVALMVILLIIGFMIFATGGFVGAYTSNIDGTVSVSLTVLGQPPKTGATILNPVNGQEFIDDNIITISGTCESDTFVVIKDNGLIIGSVDCSSEGAFSVFAQIEYGANMLSAMNYNNVNHAGPETPEVIVNLIRSETSVDGGGKEGPSEIPEVPENPVIITGSGNNEMNSCNDYNVGELSIGGAPHIEIVCLTRLFLPKVQQVMGLLVWGGIPPYAISVDLGDDSDSILISMSAPGYKTISFNYAVPNTYKVMTRMTDSKNALSLVETSIKVSGVVLEYDENGNNLIENIVGYGWFETPVPVYFLAVALTFGFWGGDLFERRFGADYTPVRKKQLS